MDRISQAHLVTKKENRMSMMNTSGSRRLVAALAAALALGLGAVAEAQVTTGGITGRLALEDGSGVPGAEMVAVHVPTGNRYTSITQADGRFRIPNVRVGGPYTIVTAQGFQTARREEVQVPLGADVNIDLEARLEAITETIEVMGSIDELINPNHGAGSTVSSAQIESLPSVQRSLQDFARTNPYFNVDAGDASATRVTVAGRNNRFNTIQIDGAVNNDLFGLADTGTPGGQADTQPISLDAIQQLQLVVSPYDVRQAGFTGGGINAVTRSGTNDWHGSAYGTSRDESMVGELNGREVSSFDQEQLGLWVAGPIVRDKAFFFVSGEMNSRDKPTGFSADGNATNQFRNPALATAVGDVLRTTYGYDPGGLGEFVFATESDLLLGKLDWIVAPNHFFTFRHNYVDAAADRIEGAQSTASGVFSYPDHYYDFGSETNSTVVQLNSTFGSNLFNEARVGVQTIKDKRATGPLFPHVEVTQDGSRVNAGVNRFSQANALDQDILEITDNVTWLRGNHSYTFGHPQRAVHLPEPVLSTPLAASTPSPRWPTSRPGSPPVSRSASRTRAGMTSNSTSRSTASMPVTSGGSTRGSPCPTACGWTCRPSPTRPAATHCSTRHSESTRAMPRTGWCSGSRASESTGASDRRRQQQLRGGVGIFAGRTPYVWMSNAYANTGVEFSIPERHRDARRRSSIRHSRRRNPARRSLPRLDAIDPDFEFPRVLRTTLAYDRRLPWGMRRHRRGDLVADGEGRLLHRTTTWSWSVRSPDGRPRYARRARTHRLGLFPTNTDEGEELNLSIQLRKRFDFGLDVRAQYGYGDAESLATSRRAARSRTCGSRRRGTPRPRGRHDLLRDRAPRSPGGHVHLRDRSGRTTPSALFYTVQSGAPIAACSATTSTSTTSTRPATT